MSESITLYRSLGTKELELIEASDRRGFPPRLPEQPIFYPVTNEGYARRIARDWNAKHNDDRRGYVTCFQVSAAFLAGYEKRVVGGREHEEYWIPAEHLSAFNAALLGPIEVIAEYEGDSAQPPFPLEGGRVGDGGAATHQPRNWPAASPVTLSLQRDGNEAHPPVGQSAVDRPSPPSPTHSRSSRKQEQAPRA